MCAKISAVPFKCARLHLPHPQVSSGLFYAAEPWIAPPLNKLIPLAMILLSWSTCANTTAHISTLAITYAVSIALLNLARNARIAFCYLRVYAFDNIFGAVLKVLHILCFLAEILVASVSLVSGCAGPDSHYMIAIICGFLWIDTVWYDFDIDLKYLISPMKRPKNKYVVWFLVWLIAILFYFQLSIDGNKLEGFSKVFCKLENEHEIDCLVGMHNAPPKSAKDCALNGSDFCGAPLP